MRNVADASTLRAQAAMQPQCLTRFYFGVFAYSRDEVEFPIRNQPMWPGDRRAPTSTLRRRASGRLFTRASLNREIWCRGFKFDSTEGTNSTKKVDKRVRLRARSVWIQPMRHAPLSLLRLGLRGKLATLILNIYDPAL